MPTQTILRRRPVDAVDEIGQARDVVRGERTANFQGFGRRRGGAEQARQHRPRFLVAGRAPPDSADFPG